MASNTTYYRRLKRSRELGVSPDKLPDGRGKHSNHANSSNHYRWNNGKLMTQDGYALIRVGISHPMADPNGYCREHDLIMASFLGRPLRENEIVHHKNEDKTDNRIENLQLSTKSGHNQIHGRTKLTPEKVKQIRELYASAKASQVELAQMYGVTNRTISKIVHGKKWANVGGPIINIDCRVKDPQTGQFVGKKTAGRLLDGVEWSQYPGRCNHD